MLSLRTLKLTDIHSPSEYGAKELVATTFADVPSTARSVKLGAKAVVVRG
jgi:hypothetical protein